MKCGICNADYFDDYIKKEPCEYCKKILCIYCFYSKKHAELGCEVGGVSVVDTKGRDSTVWPDNTCGRCGFPRGLEHWCIYPLKKRSG